MKKKKINGKNSRSFFFIFEKNSLIKRFTRAAVFIISSHTKLEIMIWNISRKIFDLIFLTKYNSPNYKRKIKSTRE